MNAFRTHRWLAIVAACLLLLGTSAPALERLSCSMGCATTIGIGSVEDCCADEHDDHGSAFLPDDCCDVERTAPEHHAYTTETTTILSGPLANTTERVSLDLPVLLDASLAYGLCMRPPPLLTTERLSLVSSYLL